MFPFASLIVGILLIAVFVVHSAEPEVIAIKDGKILTMTGKVYERGLVVIKNGKIDKVGRSGRIPRNAKVIDAKGKYVMPGVIDAMTYYGVTPFSPNVPQPVTPANRIADAYYAFGDLFTGEGGIQAEAELLCGGITTVYIAPGSGQLISGQGAVLKTNGRTYDSMVVRDPASIDMTMAYAPVGQFGAPPGPRPTRMSSMALLRTTLMGAKAYAQKVKAYNGKSAEEKEKASKPPRDLGNEALGKLLNREIPARVEADYVDDILAAIRVSEEFGLRLIIDSGIGAYKVREVLAEKKIPVVLGPVSHPIGFIHYNNVHDIQALETESNAALLAEAGVKIAFGSHSLNFGGSGKATQGRWLLLEAALATSFGLTEEEALKAVTINAAEILGVSKRIGSIEKGKDGDVIILSGHPLKIESLVEHVIIDGILSYNRAKENQ
jgi:imidazolonepropionase-like amidohydrolase